MTIASKPLICRIKPGMVGPTIAVLSFYWFIATLNLLGLFVLRANLLCQAICECTRLLSRPKYNGILSVIKHYFTFLLNKLLVVCHISYVCLMI